MKAALRVSVMPPMLFAVKIDRMFASKWLNDQLFKFGFSELYHKVNYFKQEFIISEDVEQISSAYIALGEDGFVTFAKGNVDRNVNILDGRETFHGRCLIAIVTKTERLLRNHLFIFDLIIILK